MGARIGVLLILEQARADTGLTGQIGLRLVPNLRQRPTRDIRDERIYFLPLFEPSENVAGLALDVGRLRITVAVAAGTCPLSVIGTRIGSQRLGWDRLGPLGEEPVEQHGASTQRKLGEVDHALAGDLHDRLRVLLLDVLSHVADALRASRLLAF